MWSLEKTNVALSWGPNGPYTVFFGSGAVVDVIPDDLEHNVYSKEILNHSYHPFGSHLWHSIVHNDFDVEEEGEDEAAFLCRN